MERIIKFEFVERVKQLPNFGAEGSCTRLPERSTKKAAGYDFYNLEEVTIEPNEIKYVKTGVKATFPEDIALLLLNRSSNPKKKGLELANGVGLVDADYYNNPDNEGEIFFQVINLSPVNIILHKGDTIGQGIIRKYEITEDDIAEGERISGFGSTGANFV